MLLRLSERLERWNLNRHGFASRWHSTPHGRMHVYERPGADRRAPIVILHGVGSSATAFAAVMLALASGRRVLVPDSLGHGFSDKPSALTPTTLFAGLRAVLDEALDEPAILFGNSMGGALALHYTLEQPERVARLVLSSPAAAPMNATELSALLENFHFRNVDDCGRFLLKLYHQPPWYLPLIRGDLFEVFTSTPIRHLFDSTTPADFSRGGEIAHLPMPLLLIWGQSEKLIPPAHLEFFRAHLPKQGKLIEPERVGHVPHLERPRMLARHITEFADGA
jgi:pimeloyl-ACP methyl ester carboxylesterase